MDGQNKQKIRNRFGRTNENVKEVFTIWNERAIVIDSLEGLIAGRRGYAQDMFNRKE